MKKLSINIVIAIVGLAIGAALHAIFPLEKVLNAPVKAATMPRIVNCPSATHFIVQFPNLPTM